MKMRRYPGFMAALGLVIAAQNACNAGEFGIRHNMPPAQRLAEPGPMVGGPGPGVLLPETIPFLGALGELVCRSPRCRSYSINPNRCRSCTTWSAITPSPATVGGSSRLEFPQGGIYRMKLTNIEGRAGVELYPTLEIAVATPRTAAYLAHNAVPIQFSEEDFEQALSSNFVTKVIYLPDPEFPRRCVGGDRYSGQHPPRTRIGSDHRGRSARRYLGDPSLG